MRSDDAAINGEQRTFIERARRAQIVGHAIDVIAEEGFRHASFARIAARAGISKGVVPYHFATKDELIRQVAAEVARTGAAVVRPRVLAEPTAAGKLRAWIEANLAFMRTHRNHLLTLIAIWASVPPDERDATGGHVRDHRVADLARILLLGQEEGAFRRFSPRVMALAIVQAVDGVASESVANPDLDLDAWARELVALFDRATRRTEEDG